MSKTTDKETYLAVPYEEREEVKKAAGKLKNGQNALRFDKESKLWVAKAGADLSNLERWIPKETALDSNTKLSAEEEFTQTLEAHGFVMDSPAIMNGKVQRVATLDDKPGEKTGVYKGFLDGKPAGWYQDHRKDDEIQKWVATGQQVSAELSANAKAIAAQKKAERDAELVTLHNKKAKAAQYVYNQASPISQHQYTHSKGVDIDDKLRVGNDGRLMIPLQNKSGEIRTLQFIDPNGDKALMKDAQKEGAFMVVGGDFKDIKNGDDLLYAEGYSTAKSLNMALNKPVIMTVDAGNMVKVGKDLSEQFPDSKNIFLADDDRFKEKNKGRTKATEAAELTNGEAHFPNFKDGDNGVDFNDLHQSQGIDELRQQLQHVINADKEQVSFQPTQQTEQYPDYMPDYDDNEQHLHIDDIPADWYQEQDLQESKTMTQEQNVFTDDLDDEITKALNQPVTPPKEQTLDLTEAERQALKSVPIEQVYQDLDEDIKTDWITKLKENNYHTLDDLVAENIHDYRNPNQDHIDERYNLYRHLDEKTTNVSIAMDQNFTESDLPRHIDIAKKSTIHLENAVRETLDLERNATQQAQNSIEPILEQEQTKSTEATAEAEEEQTKPTEVTAEAEEEQTKPTEVTAEAEEEQAKPTEATTEAEEEQQFKRKVTEQESIASDVGPIIPERVKRDYINVHDRYYFNSKPDQLAFEDNGDKLRTTLNNQKVASTLVDIADTRGWTKLNVKGDETFKREVWLEAASRGLEVKGYTPKEADLSILKKRIAQRQDNEISDQSPGRKKAATTDKAQEKTESTEAKQPNPSQPPEKSEPVNKLKGELVAHGEAPYEHNKDNKKSYYVTLKNEDGIERTTWGVDLKSAMKQSKVQKGDQIELENLGRKPVEVPKQIKDENGKVIKTETINTYRNKWEVKADALREQPLDKVLKDNPDLVNEVAIMKLAEKLAKEKNFTPENQDQFLDKIKERLAKTVEQGKATKPVTIPEPEQDQEKEQTR